MARSIPVAPGWLGWILLVVCALGTSLPSRGQSAPAPESANLDAIKVKIAWLADRDTFACLLGAHATESGLEVCGRVPSERVHKRALALAHAHSASRIVDRLEVNSHMIKRQRNESSADALQRQAVAVLTKALGDRTRTYRVTGAANGVVLVAGTATSYEEKLLVSQELRLLNACVCVLNQLVVDTAQGDESAPPAVSAEEQPSAPAPILPTASLPGAGSARPTPPAGIPAMAAAVQVPQLPAIPAPIPAIAAVAPQPQLPAIPAPIPAIAAVAPQPQLPAIPAPIPAIAAVAPQPQLPAIPAPIPAIAAVAPQPQLPVIINSLPAIAPAAPPDKQGQAAYSLPPSPVPAKAPMPAPASRPAERWSGSITTATFTSGPLVAPTGSHPAPVANPCPIPCPPAPGPALPGGVQTEGLMLPAPAMPPAAPRAAVRTEQEAVRTVAFTSGPALQPTEPPAKNNVPSTLPSSVTQPATGLPVPGETKPATARPTYSSDKAEIDGWSLWAVGLTFGSLVLVVAVALSYRWLFRTFAPANTSSTEKKDSKAQEINGINNRVKLASQLPRRDVPVERGVPEQPATENTVSTEQDQEGVLANALMTRSPDRAPAAWSGPETAPQRGGGPETGPQRGGPENAPQRSAFPVLLTSFVPPSALSVASKSKAEEPGVSVRWIGPQTVRLGQPVTCQIWARNLSSGPVHQVVVRHELPAAVTLQGTTPEAVREGSWLSWPLGTLQPGQEERIDLHLLPESKADLNCEAHVTFTGSSTLCMQVREPSLALQVSAPDAVMLGQTATILVVVTNSGDGMAENVKVTAALPDGLEHAGEQEIAMELGNLAPGESRTVQLLCGSTAGGLQRCEIVAVADGARPVKDLAVLDVLLPQLALAVAGPKRRYIDRHASYTIRVTNPGSAPASNVTITHQIPHGLTFHAASAGGRHDATTGAVSWFVGDLLPGQTGEVSLELVAAAAGTCTQSTTAQAVGGLRAKSEVVLLVEGLSALQMEIVNLEDPVEVGAETVYEIRVTNAGSRAETGVELTCTLPSGLEFRSRTSDAGAGSLLHGSEIAFEPLPELAPRAETIYRVQAIGQSAGDLRFRAHLTARGLPEPVLREKSIKVYGDEVAVR